LHGGWGFTFDGPTPHIDARIRRQPIHQSHDQPLGKLQITGRRPAIANPAPLRRHRTTAQKGGIDSRGQQLAQRGGNHCGVCLRCIGHILPMTSAGRVQDCPVTASILRSMLQRCQNASERSRLGCQKRSFGVCVSLIGIFNFKLRRDPFRGVDGTFGVRIFQMISRLKRGLECPDRRPVRLDRRKDRIIARSQPAQRSCHGWHSNSGHGRNAGQQAPAG
jgi:hypothetical protein